MPECVLVVDDDPVQRRLLENMLQRFGYDAVVADSGDAATALLCGPEGSRFAAVVLDLVMPDLDGLGVLARMRAAKVNIPVIVQTAHGGIDNVVSAMRAGAADFVVKPAGAERLQVSLRNALSAKALEGELQRIKRSLPPACESVPLAPLAINEPSLRLIDHDGHLRPLDALESDVIRFAIEHYRGRMSEVARRLKIGRSTLYRKLESLELEAGGDTVKHPMAAE